MLRTCGRLQSKETLFETLMFRGYNRKASRVIPQLSMIEEEMFKNTRESIVDTENRSDGSRGVVSDILRVKLFQ